MSELMSDTPDRPAVSRRATVIGLTVGGPTVGSSVTAQEQPKGSGGGTTHTVNMTDSLKFDPESIKIAVGDTVVWKNVGSIAHSVTAYENKIPSDATYFASGGYDSEQAARDGYSADDPDSGSIPGGESYKHTFETTGTFPYFCIPHEAAGMKGEVEVVEQLGGSGGSKPAVPPRAKLVAVATTGGVALVTALAIIFMKFGGSRGDKE